MHKTCIVKVSNIIRQVAEAERRTREELQQRLDQQDKVVTQLSADLEKVSIGCSGVGVMWLCYPYFLLL